MRPVPCRSSEASNPVNRPPAISTVEDELAELSLEIGLHVEQLQAEHLRVDRERMRSAEAGGERLVDEAVSLRRLLGNCGDGVFEDVTFPPSHEAGWYAVVATSFRERTASRQRG